ncbi:uncharacterized protein B0I36DRAFT_335012 [Microdochium trichocladiopsis]|uniref:Uncharacterized protein n=1 Tax=Microdochium trichocladiopsis TaxID=1682393 RepID=A0A9P8XW38_9PEZI|nr:uncharacterized protein B0I36DRAFT_335012 [Microdochium trichocladiopsis]KAH7021646.1 hypothetical protein B0I36DRAFT_335012 [Microdochium trichocladiopsis]
MVFPSFLTLCGADHSSTRDRNTNKNTTGTPTRSPIRTTTCLFYPEKSIGMCPVAAENAHVDYVERERRLDQLQEQLIKEQNKVDEARERLIDEQERLDEQEQLLDEQEQRLIEKQEQLDQEKKRLKEEQELDTLTARLHALSEGGNVDCRFRL